MATALRRADIDGFLALGRLAVVGVSRQPKDFSRGLFRELAGRGYDVVAVNPAAGDDVEGRPCYPSVEAIPGGVEGVLVMTAASGSREVLEACARAGIRWAWLFQGGGPGAVSDEALAFGREHGITVVPGACPYMFLPNTGAVHRVHGFFKKIAGRWPR